MKYILMCIVTLIICLAGGFVLVRLVEKLFHKRFTRAVEWIGSLVCGIAVLISVSLGYLSIYYHADEQAYNEACHRDSVNVAKVDGGTFFDGPGEETALVFYPGAKVEDRAYAPLMTRLAENGIDCFIVKVPFRMAMFAANGASEFIRNYEYENWILAGHSMGGIAASGFAADHADVVSQVVMLASYPTRKMPDSLEYISIYGSNDKCLGMGPYEDAKQYWPRDSREICIKGGNHAQMGNYGFQKGDGEADISGIEQQIAVVEAICAR